MNKIEIIQSLVNKAAHGSCMPEESHAALQMAETWSKKLGFTQLSDMIKPNIKPAAVFDWDSVAQRRIEELENQVIALSKELDKKSPEMVIRRHNVAYSAVFDRIIKHCKDNSVTKFTKRDIRPYGAELGYDNPRSVDDIIFELAQEHRIFDTGMKIARLKVYTIKQSKKS